MRELGLDAGARESWNSGDGDDEEVMVVGGLGGE